MLYVHYICCTYTWYMNAMPYFTSNVLALLTWLTNFKEEKLITHLKTWRCMMYNNMWLILMKRDFFLQLEMQLGFPLLGSLSVPTVLLTCMMVHRAKNRSYGSIRFVISSIVLGSHQYWQLIAWSVNHKARLAVIVSPITMLSGN